MKALIKSITLYLFVGLLWRCAMDEPSTISSVDDSNKAVIHFSIDFRETERFSTGDSLTPEERKQLFNYLKGRVDTVEFKFFANIKPTDWTNQNYVYHFKFPVVNGVCAGKMEVASGFIYFFLVRTNSDVKGYNSIDFTADDSLDIDIQNPEVINLTVNLQRSGSYKGIFVIDNPPGNYIEGQLYQIRSIKIISGSKIFSTTWVGSWDVGKMVYNNDRLICFASFHRWAGRSVFKLSDDINEMVINFNVLNIINDDSVEVTVLPPSLINFQIGFNGDIDPQVVFTDPADKAVDVSVASTVYITFNKVAINWSEASPVFILKDAQGNEIISLNSGFSSGCFFFNPSDSFEPNTVYTATISGIEDEYGNKMSGSYSWSFTTAL